jgi:hypothetical protein
MIFPAHDSVVLKLAESVDQIPATILTSGLKTCQLARSKRNTCSELREIVACPAVYENFDSEEIEFPVFLKPDVGQGSRGALVARDAVELEFHMKRTDGLMALEYLPGDEFTVDCFTDRHGQLAFVGPRRRCRIANGIAVNTEPADHPEPFVEIAEKLNRHLKFRGVWFFQVKRARNQELTLLEFAPRVGGSMALHRNLGINLPLLAVLDALNLDIRTHQNKIGFSMDRAWYNRFSMDYRFENVYMDFDDCLLIRDQLNPDAIKFLVQCHNFGIRVVLVSRHDGDLHARLEELRIGKLFDEVVHLRDSTPKSQFIDKLPAILIDDSFSERQEVHNALGIPVFDVDAIECLVNQERFNVA